MVRDNLRDVWLMFVWFGGIGVVWSAVRAWRVNRNKVWPLCHGSRKVNHDG